MPRVVPGDAPTFEPSFTLFESKLQRPVARPAIVPREGLVERLHAVGRSDSVDRRAPRVRQDNAAFAVG